MESKFNTFLTICKSSKTTFQKLWIESLAIQYNQKCDSHRLLWSIIEPIERVFLAYTLEKTHVLSELPPVGQIALPRMVNGFRSKFLQKTKKC